MHVGLIAKLSEMHKGKRGHCSQAMELEREVLQDFLNGSSSMLMAQKYECSVFETTSREPVYMNSKNMAERSSSSSKKLKKSLSSSSSSLSSPCSFVYAAWIL